MKLLIEFDLWRSWPERVRKDAYEQAKHEEIEEAHKLTVASITDEIIKTHTAKCILNAYAINRVRYEISQAAREPDLLIYTISIFDRHLTATFDKAYQAISTTHISPEYHLSDEKLKKEILLRRHSTAGALKAMKESLPTAKNAKAYYEIVYGIESKLDYLNWVFENGILWGARTVAHIDDRASFARLMGTVTYRNIFGAASCEIRC